MGGFKSGRVTYKDAPFEIGKYLASLRISKGLTRRQFYDMLGFSKSFATFKNIEQGQTNIPGVQWIRRWLRVLGINDKKIYRKAILVYATSLRTFEILMYRFPFEDKLRLVAFQKMCNENKSGPHLRIPKAIADAIDAEIAKGIEYKDTYCDVTTAGGDNSPVEGKTMIMNSEGIFIKDEEDGDT